MLWRYGYIPVVRNSDRLESPVRLVHFRCEKTEVIEMNENQKAALVSNLMVVLCSESETNPVINAGHNAA